MRICLRGRLEACRFELCEDEAIHGIFDPGAVFDLGLCRTLRLDERPMRLPWRALSDPLFHKRDLLRLQLLVRIRRRHEIVFVLRDEALEEVADLRLVFDDGGLLAVLGGEEACFGVEPQAGFARAWIGAVAVEAGVCEDGADVLVEANRLRRHG